MTLETMAQLGEFVGGFGVIFSFVYLAIQMRSNTNTLRAERVKTKSTKFHMNALLKGLLKSTKILLKYFKN